MGCEFIGVDIAKAKFDAALKKHKSEDQSEIITKAFDNKRSGFTAFLKWIRANVKETDFHICMEATGIYSDALAMYLHKGGYKISVVNPAQIKLFSRSCLSRTKTDIQDAIMIRLYAEKMLPKPWEPPSKSSKELRALVMQLEHCCEQKQKQECRLKVATTKATRDSIRRMLSPIMQEIVLLEKLIKTHVDNDSGMKEKRQLMTSIPGIGDKTAWKMLSLLPDAKLFASARQVEAFVGLNPAQHQSGSSVRGRAHISKIGNKGLRKALFLPAMVASKHSDVMKIYKARLLGKGKPGKVILCAIMRRLIRIIYGVLKSGKPYDPKLAMAS